MKKTAENKVELNNLCRQFMAPYLSWRQEFNLRKNEILVLWHTWGQVILCTSTWPVTFQFGRVDKSGTSLTRRVSKWASTEASWLGHKAKNDPLQMVSSTTNYPRVMKQSKRHRFALHQRCRDNLLQSVDYALYCLQPSPILRIVRQGILLPKGHRSTLRSAIEARVVLEWVQG